MLCIYTLTEKCQFLWGIYYMESMYSCIMKVKSKTFNEKVVFLSRGRIFEDFIFILGIPTYIHL